MDLQSTDSCPLLRVSDGHYPNPVARGVVPLYSRGMDPERERLLSEARGAYQRAAWADALGCFCEAERSGPLDTPDLELLAWSAALTGKDPVMIACLEQLYQRQMEENRIAEAARWAFWLGFRLGILGEIGRATAWMQRAQRLTDEIAGGSVVSGYLLLPIAQQSMFKGDFAQAESNAIAAAETGERFADRDLVAFARNLQGRVLVRQGRIPEGLALLDESMLAAASGELTPLFTGLIYCAVIATCHRVYALERAREWTSAFADWCRPRPQMATFSGICRVHRAEIMQISGAWPEAVAEAQRAFEVLADHTDPDPAAAACYQEAEIYRLRGEFAAAERAYREASRRGAEPQPGLSLLRLAQGQHEDAAASIRRIAGASGDPLLRAKFLPAFIEIMLEIGAIDDARDASEELARTARTYETEVLGAMAADAHGAVALAMGDAQEALTHLKQAFATWQKIGAPYLAARLRVRIGRACQALDDEEGAVLQWEAARGVFEDLRAAPDLMALARLRPGELARDPCGLTPREIEVLRLLATGMTNRAIAEALHLSSKTVDRHVGNIFNKLDVSSRAAATGYAYRQNLL
jgi:DNA-binding NarL/FixJ family response regulator